MKKNKIINIFSIFLVILLFSASVIFFQVQNTYPEKLMLIQGEEFSPELKYPMQLSVKADISGELKSDGKVKNSTSGLTFKPEKNGNYYVDLRLFGIIPIRTINIEVIPKKMVIPCGKTVGVKIYTDGILTIGFSPVIGLDDKKYEPWKKASLKVGDVILSVEGENIQDSQHLVRLIENSNGKTLSLKIKRGEEELLTEIKPVKSKESNKYKIGLWIRDSTAGIGTLTFYDPESNYFGALGHGISDANTGSLLNVKEGKIVDSKIVSVRKGKKGIPGELKGIFLKDERPIGSVDLNTCSGIFGILNNKHIVSQQKAIPIATRNQIKEGKAYILSNVENDIVKKYEIEIEKILNNNDISSKGMVIRITDKDLINKTGGIVQGMSGSPIIQDDKLIGAVTHVFVNDPTKGYGIFIEWMLNKGLDKTTG